MVRSADRRRTRLGLAERQDELRFQASLRYYFHHEIVKLNCQPGLNTQPRVLAFTIIAAMTLARIWFLGRSGLELYGDEAQYFAWSRDLALGYFTKPPLIAWLIAGTTALYRTARICPVRLGAPLCRCGHSYFAVLHWLAAV